MRTLERLFFLGMGFASCVAAIAILFFGFEPKPQLVAAVAFIALAGVTVERLARRGNL